MYVFKDGANMAITRILRDVCGYDRPCYVGLGLFLLLAVRNLSAHRLLIAFAAWSSLLHASVMTIQTVETFSHGVHRDYKDVVIAAVIGGILLVVVPPKQKSADTISP